MGKNLKKETGENWPKLAKINEEKNWEQLSRIENFTKR